MDRLMALQAFARVVELGGFTKASDSLQMSKTSVSDLVQSLEKHLGVRLLQRTTRRVTVTADGAAFYERCALILADLDEAEASVMQARVAPKGRLRVDMPGALARIFIIPKLPAFLAKQAIEAGPAARTGTPRGKKIVINPLLSPEFGSSSASRKQGDD
jgi:DNA-binding transcriptional LysR family regulator